MKEPQRQACVERVREVEALRYHPEAIDLCLTGLREQLAHVSGRDGLIAQVEALLRAGNAARAARLLQEMPLTRALPVGLWVGVSLGAVGAFVGGLFLVIHSRFERADAEARAQLLPTSDAADRAIERADAEVTGLTEAFMSDIAAGRIDAAYAKMSDSYRAVVAHGRFKAALDATVTLRGDPKPSLNHLDFQAGTAEVRGTLTTAGRERVLFKASYLREREGWRVTSLAVGNVPVLPQGPP
jgi:hypothetical protein